MRLRDVGADFPSWLASGYAAAMSAPDSSEPNRRLKMADIASMVGVSTSTISRALAGNPVIPRALRERIEEIARENGYVVNQQARGLRTQRTHVINVAIPLGHESGQLISDPFFLEMIGRLADEITARGYELLLSKVAAPEAGWLERMARSQRVDGVLVIGQSDQHQALNATAEWYEPLVVWGGAAEGARYCTVGVDNFAGGRMATEHLLALGRRRIAFLGPPQAPEVALRYEGYRQALASAGVAYDPTLTATTHFTLSDPSEGVRRLIDEGASFDAVFAASDLIGLESVRVLAAEGFEVPDTVSVVGFDDIALARQSVPALTTIRQNLAEGAARMVDLLFRRMAGELTPSAMMQPSLIVRQT
jgi:DNA-binding LacI/PurR family transcriptional regulator